jgi:hypothetical protein
MTGEAARMAGETARTDGGAMARRDGQGSTLSAQRAFVVHFGTGDGSGRRRFRGRVEHLSSGRSAHFASLGELLRFFAGALDASAGAAPRGGHDRPGSSAGWP